RSNARGTVRVLGSNRSLKTTSYSVRPNFSSVKPRAVPVISAYTATNIIEVTLDDLSQISKVIDSATQSGANTIHGLHYRLKNLVDVTSDILSGGIIVGAWRRNIRP